MFGLLVDGREVGFSGIAIWGVEGDRLAECWIERASFEAWQRLKQA